MAGACRNPPASARARSAGRKKAAAAAATPAAAAGAADKQRNLKDYFNTVKVRSRALQLLLLLCFRVPVTAM